MDTQNEVMQFEVVKNVTLPFIILKEDGVKNYIRFDSKIEADSSTFSERVRKARAGTEDAQKPMDIALITNLATKEEGRLVVHDVLKNILFESYPDGSYVDKSFQIVKSKAAGKRYFNFDVKEIRLKNAAPETVAKKAAK